MEQLFKGIKKVLELLLIVIFIVLVVDVVWQVIARYAKISSGFTEELSRFLLIWLAVIATAYSRSYKGQMAIDYFYEKFSIKGKYILSLFIELSIMSFALAVMVFGGINLVNITLKLGQLSPSLGVPIGYVYSIVPVCGIIILFFSLYHIINYRRDHKEGISTNKIV
ncbi:TRAP-type C4-dicarboxylate transport system permease small subunit [Wenyingzhuangia heitensis]|uniref:TRAP-type C4-dicarboxylate transport system permease small subunit n=1 Tax=Wenyingzhuangia heitensis TaxID=1487859 RepID=A0ABX0UGW0_9FLAO|nr:TRAP transporter small permease [Wenyingzhuangia heitensis]NIJ46247.1 TRAP-type C4-dicarboxylate transport system permease small subunit [Wenyingzhuangia heitensis]